MSEMTPGQFMQQAIDGGTGGAPGFKFQNLGDVCKGVIVHQEMRQRTEMGDNTKKIFNADGSPSWQLVVTLQTDLRGWAGLKNPPTFVQQLPGQPPQTFYKDPSEDDGKRRVFIWYKMRDAVVQACIKVSTHELVDGATLGIKWTGTEPNPKGNEPIKTYEAFYRQPAASAGFVGQMANDAPAPVQQAPQYAPTPVQQQQAPQYAPVQQQAAPQYAPAPVQQQAPPQYAPAPQFQPTPGAPAYQPPVGVPAGQYPQQPAGLQQPIAPTQQASEPPF